MVRYYTYLMSQMAKSTSAMSILIQTPDLSVHVEIDCWGGVWNTEDKKVERQE